uniref:Uncharacterized protein n=1 Tax=Musca domestica TaxID=7370 RepID=A0A1I8MM99_MUSDO
MFIKITFIILALHHFQCVASSPEAQQITEKIPTECKFPDNSNGNCVPLENCAAAITGKDATECYRHNNNTYVCCKYNLWSEYKPKKLTDGCGVPIVNIIRGLLTKEKEFPYMAALGWESTFFDEPFEYKCGGVLITPTYVLTAAHCARLNGQSPSVVLVGGNNLKDTSNKPINIAEIIVYPDYKRNESYHDIALIKLEHYVIETSACIWSLYAMDKVNLTAIGYGTTQFAGPTSDSLLKTYLSVVPNKQCSTHFRDEATLPRGLHESQFCAQDFERNSDTCQGDSGGPLIMNSINPQGFNTPFVVGITSFGRGCALEIPGVYTRVSEYVDWIDNVVYNKTRAV